MHGLYRGIGRAVGSGKPERSMRAVDASGAAASLAPVPPSVES